MTKLVQEHLPELFIRLHLVYENCKLQSLNSLHLEEFCAVLITLGVHLQLPLYLEHYGRDFGKFQSLPLPVAPASALPNPPSIFDHLHTILNNTAGHYPFLEAPACRLSQVVVRLFELLSGEYLLTSRRSGGCGSGYDRAWFYPPGAEPLALWSANATI